MLKHRVLVAGIFSPLLALVLNIIFIQTLLCEKYASMSRAPTQTGVQADESRMLRHDQNGQP
jgi:hypothetical protein